MPYPKHCLAVLCLVLFGSQLSFAQLSSNGPTTWWPDPSTGLMWTGQTTWGLHKDKNWEQARDYCTSLKLGGFSNWRLPTLNEVKAITAYHHVVPKEHARGSGPRMPNDAIIHDKGPDFPPQPYDALAFKGGITVPEPFTVWTSTMQGSQAWTVAAGNPGNQWGFSTFNAVSLTSTWFRTAICTRPMEPDLLQIAKDAQASVPVPDLQTLKATVPLAKAKLAYQAGQFQESITQAQASLAIMPNWAPAYWAMGIAYGRMGQWDQAVSNLQTALKIVKGFDAAKSSLKWAKAGQKSAKSGSQPKAPPPVWN